jgi:hypothetical protein
LTVRTDCFSTGIRAMRLRACVSDHVALPVESRNEHGTVVLIAAWLVRREQRRLTTLRSHISQPFTEATVTEFVGTAEELNGIIGTERSNARLHGPIVFITKRQNVRPHGLSLAFVVRHISPNSFVSRRRLFKGSAFSRKERIRL